MPMPEEDEGVVYLHRVIRGFPGRHAERQWREPTLEGKAVKLLVDMQRWCEANAMDFDDVLGRARHAHMHDSKGRPQ